MSELSDYIDNLKKQGYSDDYIRKYLKDYGYQGSQVEAALHDHRLDTTAHLHISYIVVALVVIGALAFIVINMFSVDGEALLDVETDPRFNSVPPGSSLGFTISVTNLGSKEKFDVTLSYEILDESNNKVSSMEETLAISTSLSRYKSIDAPSQPGDYILRTVAVYDGKEALSSFSFEVEGNQTPEENDSVDSGVTSTMEHVREIASTQPGKAETECLQLTGTDRDDCLSIIVKESRRPEFCTNITNDNARDNCYMSFIVEGQSYLCPKIVLAENMDYCDRIKDVQILAKYYQEND